MNDSTIYNFSVIAGTTLISVMLAFIIYFIFVHYRMRIKFEYERQQFQQALLQAEIEIREQTLKHISRELHDNLGQIASLVKINLNMLANDLPEKEKDRINESLELMRQLINDIKSLSHSLNQQDLANLNFVDSVKKEAERVNKLGLVQMTYASKGMFPMLQPGTEIFLFRMFQEMVSNTIKHAGATAAQVEIDSGPKKIDILFSDNGRGFDQSYGTNGGSGISNLTERCRLIGANLSIDSHPGQGTRISISLPITAST